MTIDTGGRISETKVVGVYKSDDASRKSGIREWRDERIDGTRSV